MVGQAHYRQAAIAGIIGRLVVNCSDQDQFGTSTCCWCQKGKMGLSTIIYTLNMLDTEQLTWQISSWFRNIGGLGPDYTNIIDHSPPPTLQSVRGGGLIDNCLLVIIRDTDCLPHQQSTLFNHQPLCLWVIKIPAGISSPSSVQIWINFSHWIMQPVFVWKFVCNLWPSITIMSPLSAVTQHSHQQK